MLARVRTAATVGLEGQLVDVEADISSGLPALTIVGLPDAAVQESRERVRSAIRNSGFSYPLKRTVVNLAPAHLKKAGPAYDLPIAVGILLSSEQLSADLTDTILLGELSLDGNLRHTRGILPMVALAREAGIKKVIVPETDAREASLVPGVRVIPIGSLSQLAGYLQGEIPVPEVEFDAVTEEIPLGSRIIAVARAYEEAMSGGKSQKEAIAHIQGKSGKLFDPMVVQALLELIVIDED